MALSPITGKADDSDSALLRDHGLQSHYDVVVVGLGPTGATLANLLALQGVSVAVLEREPTIYPLPRAVHIDDETMRVFLAAGIADSLNQRLRVNPGMRFVRPDGELLLDWPRPRGACCADASRSLRYKNREKTRGTV